MGNTKKVPQRGLSPFIVRRKGFRVSTLHKYDKNAFKLLRRAILRLVRL